MPAPGSLSVPATHLEGILTAYGEGLAKQAVRTQHEITAAGYDVLGDLDRLAVGPPTEDPVVPVAAEALLLSLDLILDPVGTTVKEES